MISRLKLKSEFDRNIFALITGTTIAQIVSIVVIPILTRLYTPDDFGIFSLYSALVTTLAAFSTGRYEIAVIQARNDRDGYLLVLISLFLSAIFSIFLLIVVIFLNDTIDDMLGGNGNLRGLLYLLPPSIFVTSAYQSLSYWLNRQKLYKRMSKNMVLQAGLSGAGRIVFSFTTISGSAGLIWGNFLAQVATTVILVKGILKNPFVVNKIRLLAILKKFIAYPKHDMPASVLNLMAQQCSSILLTLFFGTIFAGHYFLIQRVFLMPITIISSSVASVFRQSAAVDYRKHGNFICLFWMTFRKLFIASIVPTVIVVLYGKELFVFAFGDNWATAGVYAQILAPMFMFKFIVSPLTYAFYVTNKLHYNIYGQAFYLLLTILSIFTGYFFDSVYLTTCLISLSSSLLYILYFIISLRLSR